MEHHALKVSLVPLSLYPKDVEGFAYLTSELYNEVMEDFLAEFPDSNTVTIYVTDFFEGVEEATGKLIDRESQGVAVVVQDLAVDALYYMGIVLKSDMFVRLMESDFSGYDRLVAVWNRQVGIGAVGRESEDTDYEVLPGDIVTSLLPTSLTFDPSLAN